MQFWHLTQEQYNLPPLFRAKAWLFAKFMSCSTLFKKSLGRLVVHESHLSYVHSQDESHIFFFLCFFVLSFLWCYDDLWKWGKHWVYMWAKFLWLIQDYLKTVTDLWLFCHQFVTNIWYFEELHKLGKLLTLIFNTFLPTIQLADIHLATVLAWSSRVDKWLQFWAHLRLYLLIKKIFTKQPYFATLLRSHIDNSIIVLIQLLIRDS